MKVLLCIVISIHLSFALGAFDVEPASTTVSAGETAGFRCQHSTVGIVSWRINGSTVGLSPPPDVSITLSITSDGVLSILSIVAREDNNGTEVVCVAGDDVSSTAVLYIADIPQSTTMPTTTPPTTTTQQGDMNPTDATAGDFLTSPLSVNVTVGSVTMFQCEHPTAVGFGWLINGTALNSQPDLHSTFIESTNGSVRTLTVTALSQYNSTRIECSAFFSNGQPRKTIPPALLLVQGPLDAVTSLTKVGSTISWGTPYSLDLTNVEPDIVYCVDVYNITCGRRDLVSSDCSVNDTNYTSLSDGYLYEYIVTPRSNVEGAQNGTADHFRDMLPTFHMNSSHLSLGGQPNKTNYQILLSHSSELPVPSSYTLSLEASDDMDGLDPIKIQNHTEKETNVVKLSVTDLEYRRLWDCTIFVLGCDKHIILKDAILSTHDFYHISLSPSAGVVRVTGRFVESSPSTGVLVIVSGDSDVSYYMSSRGGNDNHAVTIPGLAGGGYTVSVFVVEENGLPFERAAIVPEYLFVDENPAEPFSPTIEYSLEPTSTGVNIQCIFLDTDASECIVVVHRDLVNIESRLSRKFTRSGDTASGFIEGVNLEDYQVGVVGGRQLNSGSAHASNLTVIVSALIPTVALLAVIVIVLSIIVKVHHRKSHNHPGLGDAEKTENYYTTRTSSPASPTENPHDSLIVPSVERIAGIYDIIRNVPSDSPSLFSTPFSSISSNVTQVSIVSTTMGDSSAEDGNTPLYSTVGVKPQSSSSSDARQMSAVVTDSAEQSGIPKPSLYSQVEVKPQPVSVPPVNDKRVVYSEVVKTQGANDQLYTMVNPKKSTCTRETYSDDLTKVVYSEIRPNGVELPPQATTVKIIPKAPSPTPFTTENIVATLLPLASKWRAIGEAFPLSEKRLDDIETTEGDEQCLREMIEAYMMRGDLSHTWDEIVDVLKNEKVNEDTLAEKIYVMHVAPYVLTHPNQPQLPERGMYTRTRGSKPFTRNVSTDDGSLDTSSPVLSDQQTEPATSEGEIKPGKEESLRTPDGTVCAPESLQGDAVLEMPPYDDGEGVNGCHTHRTRPKGRVTVDGDSSKVEIDMSSQTMDADSSSIESEPKPLREATPVATHPVADAPAQAVDECSQEDYKSDLPLPAGSGESQCGQSDDDTAQSGLRTGPPTTQVPLPLQEAYILEQKLMEHTIACDFPSSHATEETSSASQDSEPHDNYFAAIAHQLGKLYVPRETDHPLGQQKMFSLGSTAKSGSDEETTVKQDPPNDKSSKAFITSERYSPYSPVKHVDGKCVKRTSADAKCSGCAIRRRHLRPRLKISPQYGTEPAGHVVTCDKKITKILAKHGVMNGCLNFAHPVPQKHCSYVTNDLQHTLCSYLPRKYVQSRAFAKQTNTQSCGLQATLTTTGGEGHQFLHLINDIIV